MLHISLRFILCLVRVSLLRSKHFILFTFILLRCSMAKRRKLNHVAIQARRNSCLRLLRDENDLRLRAVQFQVQTRSLPPLVRYRHRNIDVSN